MSATFAPYTIIAALQELLTMGKASTAWKPRGEGEAQQKVFLDTMFSKGIPEGGFTKEELETVGAFDVGTINSFLSEKGFNIQLEDNGDPRAIYTASVMNVLVKWLKEGTQNTVSHEGTSYPGALIKKGMRASSTPEGAPMACYQRCHQGMVASGAGSTGELGAPDPRDRIRRVPSGAAPGTRA